MDTQNSQDDYLLEREVDRERMTLIAIQTFQQRGLLPPGEPKIKPLKRRKRANGKNDITA